MQTKIFNEFRLKLKEDLTENRLQLKKDLEETQLQLKENFLTLSKEIYIIIWQMQQGTIDLGSVMLKTGKE